MTYFQFESESESLPAIAGNDAAVAAGSSFTGAGFDTVAAK